MRRQLRREFRKPLVVFTPKSLLRHPLCVSTLEDLSTGRFLELIDDIQVKPSAVKKVVFCSGKIYELFQERENSSYGRGISSLRTALSIAVRTN